MRTRRGLLRWAPSSPGPGELSPARGCGGGGGGGFPTSQGGTTGPRFTRSRGSEKWGRADSKDGTRPKATPFRYAVLLRPLQLPSAPAKDFLPPHPTPSCLPAHRSDLRTAKAESGIWCGEGAERAEVGTQNTNSHPLAEKTKCIYTGNQHTPVTGLRACAGRSSPALLLFLIKSITLPSGAEREGKERKGEERRGGGGGGAREKEGVGGSSSQLCNPALPPATRRHA